MYTRSLPSKQQLCYAMLCIHLVWKINDWNKLISQIHSMLLPFAPEVYWLKLVFVGYFTHNREKCIYREMTTRVCFPMPSDHIHHKHHVFSFLFRRCRHAMWIKNIFRQILYVTRKTLTCHYRIFHTLDFSCFS